MPEPRTRTDNESVFDAYLTFVDPMARVGCQIADRHEFVERIRPIQNETQKILLVPVAIKPSLLNRPPRSAWGTLQDPEVAGRRAHSRRG